MKVSIHSGPLIDGYLATEGAIAQAVDRNTILLGSPRLGMGPSDQRLLLLHELAHIHQLENAGADSARALEEEAWEAAHAWATGRTFRIRGRARGRLNALAIIQGGERGHPDAPPWYGSNPVEPIGNASTLKVNNVITIDPMTLETLMDTIIDKKQTEIVVVCHGWSDGLGIPLMEGSESGAQKQQLFPLSADAAFAKKAQDSGGSTAPIISDETISNLTHMSQDRVKILRVKMNGVRSLKLQHVAFRACDMGMDAGTGSAMEAFRDFFGAASVSAPKLLDMYGHFKPEFGAGVKSWADRKRRKEAFHISIDKTTDVAFGTKKNAKPLAFNLVCHAPDQESFNTWLRTHIADRAGSDNLTVFHGMMESKAIANPNDPNVHFVRDSEFISNIAFFAGSKGL